MDKRDKKEKIIQRVARIVITFVAVLLIGYIVSNYNDAVRNGGTADGQTVSSEEDTDISDVIENTDMSQFEGQTLEETDGSYEEGDSSEGSTDTAGAADDTENTDTEDTSAETKEYSFRNSSLLEQHYDKHGVEMGFASAEEYEQAASDVVNDPNALHKTEAEDGDDVYYLEATNEFVIVSQDGYIRTYFKPDAGIDYYNRQ